MNPVKQVLTTKKCLIICATLLFGPNLANADEVILDDVIVDGSLCVGQDCANEEEFSFDTVRLKENNVRIMFEDTSTTAEFPTNDWQITINDSSNGGEAYFAITDCGNPPMSGNCDSEGNRVFVIEAGAPADTLVIGADGSVLVGGLPLGYLALDEAIERIENLEAVVESLALELEAHNHKSKKSKKSKRSMK